MSPKKDAQKKFKGFTAEERAAMKEYVRELKGGETEGESAVLTATEEARISELVKEAVS